MIATFIKKILDTIDGIVDNSVNEGEVIVEPMTEQAQKLVKPFCSNPHCRERLKKKYFWDRKTNKRYCSKKCAMYTHLLTGEEVHVYKTKQKN